MVLRYWEDQGGWWEALVGDYSVKNSKHKLIYDAGGEDVNALPLYCPVSLPGHCCGAIPGCCTDTVCVVFTPVRNAFQSPDCLCMSGVDGRVAPIRVGGRLRRQLKLCALQCRRALSGQTCER